MSTKPTIDYRVLDRPEVSMSLFHPRAEYGSSDSRGTGENISIPVDEGVSIGACFHLVGKNSPNILFFHGNGEIVSDYDDLGRMYNQLDINFLPVDYRGYGRSNGEPSVSNMMQDCHFIFSFVKERLLQHNYTGPLIVMGRSLGSASALELVSSHSDDISALIIESGFALATPLLRLLGIDVNALGFEEGHGFNNTDKIAQFNKPTLIIHAEFDHIIPFTEGQALFQASGAEHKNLIKIQGANHNDIFMRGLQPYLSGITDLVKSLTE